LDRLESATLIRSLYWPGFVAFHVMETSNYGYLYVGTGKKNWDVPFMILPPPMALKASVVEGGDYPFEPIKDLLPEDGLLEEDYGYEDEIYQDE